MRRSIIAMAVLAFTVGAAQAQATNQMNKSEKGTTVGATGALGNVNANGVATDPGGVAQQQGSAMKASPGTVGAAPGAATPSQNPKH